MSRIGISMLIRRHVELHNHNPSSHCVDYIHTKCLLWKWHKMLVRMPMLFVCESIAVHLILISMVILILHSRMFQHLHLMVFKLVKNSLHVVQKRFMDSDRVAPPATTSYLFMSNSWPVAFVTSFCYEFSKFCRYW